MVRVGADEFHGEINAEHVREESGKPNHSDFPLGRVHGFRHPQGDGGFEERERHVGHDERSGAHGDVRVHDETPYWRAAGERLLVHRSLLSRRPHHEHDEEAID